MVFSRPQFPNFESLILSQHVSKAHPEREWQKMFLPRLALNTAATASEHTGQMGVRTPQTLLIRTSTLLILSQFVGLAVATQFYHHKNNKFNQKFCLFVCFKV